MTDRKPYRPASGTEAADFQAKWCDCCIHDREARVSDPSEGCPILRDTMIYDIDAPEYPDQWIQDQHGPCCTSFERDPDEPLPRCPLTKDMLEGEA